MVENIVLEEMELDKELEEMERQEAIAERERLDKWNVEQEEMRLQNIEDGKRILAEMELERQKPTLHERVEVVEVKTVTLEETIDVLFGGVE